MKASVARRIRDRLKGFADALQRGEKVENLYTCRKVVLDLQPAPYDPELVKRTRKMLGASQAIFAQFLGVSVKTVCAWERGDKTPRDVACRFMDEIRRDPDYWRARLAGAAIVTNTAKKITRRGTRRKGPETAAR